MNERQASRGGVIHAAQPGVLRSGAPAGTTVHKANPERMCALVAHLRATAASMQFQMKLTGLSFNLSGPVVAAQGAGVNGVCTIGRFVALVSDPLTFVRSWERTLTGVCASAHRPSVRCHVAGVRRTHADRDGTG
jgi:hypothetical protein